MRENCIEDEASKQHVCILRSCRRKSATVNMVEQVLNHTRKPQSEFRLTQCEVRRAKT